MTIVKAALIAALTAAATFAAPPEKPDLNAIIDPIDPDISKWASVIIIEDGPDGQPTFNWHHYKNSENDVNFWPASTIKLYAVIAAFEQLNEMKMATDSTLIFERQTEGKWVLDSARTMREMVNEVFRRSSNEDYTMLLRFTGIDRINTKFLIPERGFPHTALMRGYVLGRPYEYVREEPQRITVRDHNGRTRQIEHTWSGTSYSKQRGATIISDTTGNCTSTQELAECLRRVMFHEHLKPQERYHLTDEQIAFIRDGGPDLTGLENTDAGPYAWKNAAKKIFPNAQYFHKGGLISTYSLDLAYIYDKESNTRYILAIAAESGKTKTVTEMSLKIAEWIKGM